MEGPGMRVMAVVAISGCSLLLLVLNRRRFVGACRSVESQEREEEEEPAASPTVVYSLKSISCEVSHSADSFGVENRHTPKKSSSPGNKKKVRFSEDVEEPRSNNAEYRQRHTRGVAGGKRRREKKAEAAWVRCDLPANRKALYNGIAQFRSQRATSILYA